MQIKSIQTVTENEAALNRIQQLLDAKPNSPEADELELLTSLVMAFEEKYCPVEAPSSIAAIQFRMQQQL